MEEIKDFLHDRIVYLLVGINTFFNWIGIDNMKSMILWILTIILLIIKIRISYVNMQAKKIQNQLDLEIAKEELKARKQANFYTKWDKEFIDPFKEK